MGGYPPEWSDMLRVFPIGSVWLSSTVTFVPVSDPLAEASSPEWDGRDPTPGQSPFVRQQPREWGAGDRFSDLSAGFSPLGLEALSAAALYTSQDVTDIPRSAEFNEGMDSNAMGSPTPGVDMTTAAFSPLPLMAPVSGNIKYILNSTAEGSPIIDPRL